MKDSEARKDIRDLLRYSARQDSKIEDLHAQLRLGRIFFDWCPICKRSTAMLRQPNTTSSSSSLHTAWSSEEKERRVCLICGTSFREECEYKPYKLE